MIMIVDGYISRLSTCKRQFHVQLCTWARSTVDLFIKWTSRLGKQMTSIDRILLLGHFYSSTWHSQLSMIVDGWFSYVHVSCWFVRSTITETLSSVRKVISLRYSHPLEATVDETPQALEYCAVRTLPTCCHLTSRKHAVLFIVRERISLKR
jgi:hypothetical protein